MVSDSSVDCALLRGAGGHEASGMCRAVMELNRVASVATFPSIENVDAHEHGYMEIVRSPDPGGCAAMGLLEGDREGDTHEHGSMDSNNTQAQEYVKRQETWAPLVEVKPYKGQLFWLTNPEIDSREQPNLDKSEDLQYGTTFEYEEIKKTAIGTNPKNCHMDLNCNMDKSEKMVY
ncbi:hypothetical protein LXL04_026752 [Taraxacum kok-saghyz]